jgi:hypothetical protein
MNFQTMFDYTAIGQAMKMSGRTFNQLSAEEKEEFFNTMDIMQPTNVHDRYSYNSYMPMPMPGYMPMPGHMPMPGYVPRSRVPTPLNMDSRFDAVDQKIAGVETTMTSKFADTGREIVDIKTQIAEMVTGVKTLSHKCLTNEESIQKFKRSQHIVNYSIWICLLITVFTNYDAVKNKVSENIVYSVLILIQMYVIALLSSK